MASFFLNGQHLRQHLGRAVALVALLALSACGGGDNATTSSGPARLAAGAAAVAASASVVSLNKVRETRLSRTVYEYVFSVTVKNGPLAQSNAMVTLIGVGPGTIIIVPTAHLRDMAPGQTVTSSDAIVLRQDRRLPFDKAALVWSFGPETLAQAFTRLEAAGAIPVLNHDAALPGPDQNGNGIRDDIDTFIARQNFNMELRGAAEQLARGLQAAVVLDAADPALAQPIAARIDKGLACVYRHFPKENWGEMTAHQLVRNLQKMTANTEPRVLSYMKYNGSLNGSVATMPRGDVCEH